MIPDFAESGNQHLDEDTRRPCRFHAVWRLFLLSQRRLLSAFATEKLSLERVASPENVHIDASTSLQQHTLMTRS